MQVGGGGAGERGELGTDRGDTLLIFYEAGSITYSVFNPDVEISGLE
jgi:hypothetical protein